MHQYCNQYPSRQRQSYSLLEVTSEKQRMQKTVNFMRNWFILAILNLEPKGNLNYALKIEMMSG